MAANLASKWDPLDPNVQLKPGMQLTTPGTAPKNDPDPEDEQFRKCRSMKPGPLGCNNYRYNDTDYCKKHYDIIAAEGNL